MKILETTENDVIILIEFNEVDTANGLTSMMVGGGTAIAPIEGADNDTIRKNAYKELEAKIKDIDDNYIEPVAKPEKIKKDGDIVKYK